jgi:hypothetical protein
VAEAAVTECEQGTHHRVHHNYPGRIVVEPRDVLLAVQLEEAGEGGIHHDEDNDKDHTRRHQSVLLAEGLAGVGASGSQSILGGSWGVGLVEVVAQP